MNRKGREEGFCFSGGLRNSTSPFTGPEGVFRVNSASGTAPILPRNSASPPVIERLRKVADTSRLPRLNFTAPPLPSFGTQARGARVFLLGWGTWAMVEQHRT